MKLSEIVEFNPSTPLRRGTVAPFVDMASLPTTERYFRITETREFKGSGSKFRDGDTLLARITPCLENGKGGFVRGLGRGVAAHGSTEFIVLRPKKTSDADFVYYVTRHPDFRSFAIKQMSGTSGRQRVAWQALTDYELVDLTPFERAALGSLLSALDDKIELNRRMNATLETMARAIFRDWFVDFGPTRAKIEGREPYLAPDLWPLFPARLTDQGIPEGWEMGTLGDVAESPRRGVKPSEIPEHTPYIGLEHMPRRSIALSEWEGAGKVTSNKSAFRKGEFLFGKLRPYFHKVGVAPVDGICSTDIVVVRPKRKEWSAYTLACISSDDFVEFTNAASTGTKMPRTSWKVMSAYETCLGTNEVVAAYQRIVAPMIERIIANIHESRTLAQTRDLLLPRLMSGELRVAEAEKIVEGGV